MWFVVFYLCLFLYYRVEKVGSEKAYKDLKSWWFQVTKKEKYNDTRAPHLPSYQEIEELRRQTFKSDGIIVYEREILSIRSIASNVKIKETYYPRDCTCLLTLKYHMAETCEDLLDNLKEISLNRMILN